MRSKNNCLLNSFRLLFLILDMWQSKRACCQPNLVIKFYTNPYHDNFSTTDMTEWSYHEQSISQPNVWRFLQCALTTVPLDSLLLIFFGFHSILYSVSVQKGTFCVCFNNRIYHPLKLKRAWCLDLGILAGLLHTELLNVSVA